MRQGLHGNATSTYAIRQENEAFRFNPKLRDVLALWTELSKRCSMSGSQTSTKNPCWDD